MIKAKNKPLLVRLINKIVDLWFPAHANLNRLPHAKVHPAVQAMALRMMMLERYL